MMSYVLPCNRDLRNAGRDRAARTRIGFTGLGVRGAPMARNLLAAGRELTVSRNRSGLPDDLQATVVPSPRPRSRGRPRW